MFASVGHPPLYFLSKMYGFEDFLPPALSQCILGFGGGMFFHVNMKQNILDMGKDVAGDMPLSQSRALKTEKSLTHHQTNASHQGKLGLAKYRL